MSRFRSASAYGHAIQHIGGGDFRIYWTVDRYYAGSRLRHPQTASRNTDRAGAERFAKRHKLTLPS